MPKVNRNELKIFLVREGCINADEIMKNLEIFFKKAESEICGFEERKENNINWKKIKIAVEELTRKKVEKINFVSAHEPIIKPGWMTKKVYQEDLLSESLGYLKKSLKQDLGLSVNISTEEKDNLKQALGSNRWDRLNKVLSECLLENLYNNFSGYLWHKLWINHWSNIFYYLGYCITKDKKNSKRLEKMLEIMDKHVVLGEKRDEKNVWLVLKN